MLDLSKVTGSTKNAKTCRPTSGLIEVCAASYGNNGWLGLAQIWISGTHITQGTAKMNDYYFNQSPYNTPAWRRLVVCQELAHDFGLNHQDENFNIRISGRAWITRPIRTVPRATSIPTPTTTSSWRSSTSM